MTQSATVSMGRLSSLLLLVLCVGAAVVRGEDDPWFPHPWRGNGIRPAAVEGTHGPLHASSDGSVPYYDNLECPDSEHDAPWYSCKTRRSAFVIKFFGVSVISSARVTEECWSSSDYDEFAMG